MTEQQNQHAQQIDEALKGYAPQEREKAKNLLEQIPEVSGKIIDLLASEKVDFGIGISACFDVAMSLVHSEFTPPLARAAFSRLLMDAAYDLSARVSEEQADGVLTADQESERPKIITEV